MKQQQMMYESKHDVVITWVGKVSFWIPLDLVFTTHMMIRPLARDFLKGKNDYSY